MSAIIEKVFNWAHKIDRAIFKGSPNLVTATDLNRQIELLKKEIFLTQQSVGPVSDFTAALTIDTSSRITATTITVPSGYVFFRGVRFSVTASVGGLITFPIQLETTKKYRINLYATKTTIREVDDSTKAISGAKFVDGTVFAAAEHYVYGSEELKFEEYTTTFFTNMERVVSGKEFICSLYEVSFLSGSPVQRVFCIPFGDSVQTKMAGTFLGRKPIPSLTFPEVASGVSVDTALKGFMDRLYTFERRMFLDNKTVHLEDSPIRTFAEEIASDNGTILISGRYIIVGSLCFASGIISSAGGSISRADITISSTTALPEAAFRMSLSIEMPGLPPITGDPVRMKYLTGYIGLNTAGSSALCFKGHIPGVADINWSVVYPMEIDFWSKLPEDTQPIFPI